MNDILIHHGIKGMKWGVRRYQDYDGTRIKNQGEYIEKVRSGDDFKIKKGDQAFRGTSNPNETSFNNRTYVSLTKSDLEKYLWGGFMTDMNYVDIYEVNEDITVAGYKEAAKILGQVYDLPLKDVPTNNFKYGYDRADYFDFGNEDDVDSKLAERITRAEDAFMDGPDTYNPYREELIKRGYDAVVDLADLSFDVDAPVIVLNNKLKKVKTYNPYSDEFDRAMRGQSK